MSYSALSERIRQTSARLDALKGGPGSGHFGHAGVPGHQGGSAPSGGGAAVSEAVTQSRSYVTAQPVTQPTVDLGRAYQLGAHHDLYEKRDEAAARLQKFARAYVTDSPNGVKAANIAADMLEKMQAQGYRMPDEIDVMETPQPSPVGVTTVEQTEADPLGDVMMEIYVPDTLPPDADLDLAVRAAFGTGDKVAVRDFKDIVIHEMGHVQHRLWLRDEATEVMPKWNSFFYGQDRQAALSVSTYAAGKPAEFVAEAFLRQYRGEQLSPEALALYKKWYGPEIKR